MRRFAYASLGALAGCFPVFGDYEAPSDGAGGAGAGGAASAGGAPPGLTIAWHTTLEAQRPAGTEVEPMLRLHGLATSATAVVVVGELRGALGAVAAPSERPLVGHVSDGGLERSRVYDVTGSTDRRGGALSGVSITGSTVRAAGTFHGALTTDAGDVLHGESGSWFVVDLDDDLQTIAAASECAEASCSPPSTAGLALAPTTLLTTRMIPGDPTPVEHLALAWLDAGGALAASTVLPRFPCESPNALGLAAAPSAALVADGERVFVAGATCEAAAPPRAFVDVVDAGGVRASVETTGDAISIARAAAPTPGGIVVAGDLRGGAMEWGGREASAPASRSVGVVAWVGAGDGGLTVERLVELKGRGDVFLTSVTTFEGRVYLAGSTEGGGLDVLPQAAVGRGRSAFVVALSQEGTFLDGIAFGDFEPGARDADRAVLLAAGEGRLAAAGAFRGAFEVGGQPATAQVSFVLELDPGGSTSR